MGGPQSYWESAWICFFTTHVLSNQLKLLHIHPLTLEDILQRNPREKLEIFPKLGYYFISFRAIETREGKERSQWQLQKMTEHLEPISHLEGVIGETTVYLAIFTEGVCCVSDSS
jgi:magnesium transporter